MSAHAKQTYRAKVKLEVFYSGGAVQLSPDGRHLACACGDEVKVCRSSCGRHENVWMRCACALPGRAPAAGRHRQSSC